MKPTNPEWKWPDSSDFRRDDEMFPEGPFRRVSRAEVSAYRVGLVVMAALFLAVGFFLAGNPRDDARLYRAYAKKHVVENTTVDTVLDWSFDRAFNEPCRPVIYQVMANNHRELAQRVRTFNRTMGEQGIEAVADVRQLPAMAPIRSLHGIGEWMETVVVCVPPDR